MEYTSTITDLGQITIPLEVREQLGVKPGDSVRLKVDSEQTALQLARHDENPFAKYAGCLGGFETMEEIVAWERDMRDPDQEYI